MKTLAALAIIAILTGCTSSVNREFQKPLPRRIQILDETNKPISGVMIGMPAPLPFGIGNPKSDRNGHLKIHKHNLTARGEVILTKKGYDAYIVDYDKVPDVIKMTPIQDDR